MSKKKDASIISSIVLAVGFLVIVLTGIYIISNATENKVIKRDAVYQDAKRGDTIIKIETVPADYHVEASFSKLWEDGRPSAFLIVIALIIGAFSQMGYSFYKGFIADSEKDLKFIGVLLLSWGFSLVVLFSGVSKRYGSSNYQTILTTEQYEQVKDNLDSLFPDSK